MIPLSIGWPYELSEIERFAVRGLVRAYIGGCEQRIAEMPRDRLEAALDVVGSETPDNIILVAMGFAYNAMRVENITEKAVSGAGRAGFDSDSPEFAMIAKAHATLGKLLDSCGEQMMATMDDKSETLLRSLRIMSGDNEQLIEDVGDIIGFTFFTSLAEMI